MYERFVRKQLVASKSEKFVAERRRMRVAPVAAFAIKSGSVPTLTTPVPKKSSSFRWSSPHSNSAGTSASSPSSGAPLFYSSAIAMK